VTTTKKENLGPIVVVRGVGSFRLALALNILQAPAVFHAVYKIFSDTIIMFLKFVLILA